MTCENRQQEERVGVPEASLRAEVPEPGHALFRTSCASESWLIVIGSVPATPSIRQPRCLHVEVGVIGQDRPAHAEIGRLVWSTEISSEKGTLWNVKRKSELIESDQRTDIDDDDIRGTGLTRE